MDILRGHAMTNPNGLVLDVVTFADAERFLALNPGAADTVLETIEDVVAGRSTVADRLRGRLQGLRRRKAARAAPVAGLFESGKARLAGRFAELEEELGGLVAGGGYARPGSPDRADAMVWALWALLLADRPEPRIWQA
jgi:phage terminase large subunit-like protein